MSSNSGSSELTVIIPENFQARANWDRGFFNCLERLFQGHSYADMILEILRKIISKESDPEMIWGIESIELTPWRVQIRFIAEKDEQKSSRIITFGTDVICLLLQAGDKFALVKQARLLNSESWELPRIMSKNGESSIAALHRLVARELGLSYQAIESPRHVTTLNSGIAAYIRPHLIFTAKLVAGFNPEPKLGFEVKFFSKSEIVAEISNGNIRDPLIPAALFVA